MSETADFENRALAEIRAAHEDFLREIDEKKVISEELDKKIGDFTPRLPTTILPTSGKRRHRKAKWQG